QIGGKSVKMAGWQIKMVQEFEAVKAELGEAEYRRILKTWEYSKSSDIPDRATGLKVYNEMKAALNDIKLRAQGNPVDEFDSHMQEESAKPRAARQPAVKHYD